MQHAGCSNDEATLSPTFCKVNGCRNGTELAVTPRLPKGPTTYVCRECYKANEADIVDTLASVVAAGASRLRAGIH